MFNLRSYKDQKIFSSLQHKKLALFAKNIHS